MLLLNFAAERYWVQNVTALILAIVWVPRWLLAYGIPFQSRPQYVGCTQYMATRTAILDVEIVLNQCLEEIAKKEAQPSRLRTVVVRHGRSAAVHGVVRAGIPVHPVLMIAMAAGVWLSVPEHAAKELNIIIV
jgi:hypothetical protein